MPPAKTPVPAPATPAQASLYQQLRSHLAELKLHDAAAALPAVLDAAAAEHLTMTATIQRMEPERLFSFTWHPYAIDQSVDYSSEPLTLVEFMLEAIPGGTLLTVVESGFAALPAHRRDEAFRMNDRGWSIQVQNISQHLGDAA